MEWKCCSRHHPRLHPSYMGLAVLLELPLVLVAASFPALLCSTPHLLPLRRFLLLLLALLLLPLLQDLHLLHMQTVAAMHLQQTWLP